MKTGYPLGERKLLCIGEASVKASGLTKLIPIHLAAFDDILIFLVKKNGKFSFAPMVIGLLLSPRISPSSRISRSSASTPSCTVPWPATPST